MNAAMKDTASPSHGLWNEMSDQFGRTLGELSERSTMLVVFLRNGGCTFCRQMLSDLTQERTRIEARGMMIVLVHQDPPEQFARIVARYAMTDVAQISDPHQKLYRMFGLRRGEWWRLLSPGVWWHGFVACLVRRHGMGPPRGDVRQLPGGFLVRDRRIVRAHRPHSPDDRFCFRQFTDPLPTAHSTEKYI